MIIDYDRLSELLNVLGVSLKIENGNAFFTDIETGRQMQSCTLKKREIEYTTDKEVLFNGWPFYIVTDNENKYCKLNIANRYGLFKVFEITKDELIEPHLYKRTKLKTDTIRSYTLEVSTYRDDKVDYISHTHFCADEPFNNRLGQICVKDGDKTGWISFLKDNESGEFVIEFESCGNEKINIEKFIQIIEQFNLFKDTMKILCPKLTEMYSINEGKTK